MDLLSNRNLRILGIVIAVLLIALAFYPGTLTTPYVQETPQQYTNTLVPEWDVDNDPTVYQYDELSPVAQEIFDRTRNVKASSEDTPGYTLDVCRDFMLICDGYHEDELPDEFTYSLSNEAHVIVEDGNESYVLRTGTSLHGNYFFITPSGIDALLSFLILFSVAVATVVVVVKSQNEYLLKGTVSGGAVIGALAFLAPYLEMLELVTASALRLLILTVPIIIAILIDVLEARS